ncbi:OR7C1 protein, partial [Crocuta crocuta]
MDSGNDTGISEFLLMGFSEKPELHPLILGLFLSMYLITMFGNLLIILAISTDPNLHTPMYFFLANLSFVDICFTSTTVPKMLWNIQTQSKAITYAGCITQMHFFILFAGLDICLLTVMAYDRFVAICHPLNYTVIMNPQLCGLLVLVSWITSVLHSLLESLMQTLLYMEPRNYSRLPMFLLLGLSEKPEIQFVLSGLFLSLYLVTALGNLLIILATISDSHLHTPMYFFLSNLSFSDICFTSTTVPKMLWNIQMQSRVITYTGCVTQMYFFTVFGLLDNLLLTAMAYDRFVAVCHPLHYTVIMNPRLCAQLLALTWLISVLGALPESLTMLRLSFCTVIEIPHYFCELPEILQLACSDTFINNVVLYIVTGMMGFFPLAGILFSYSRIVSSVLRISTAGGKYKAFSTCGSHVS